MVMDINETNIPDLALLAKQEVEGFIIGLHKSPFHGFSIEFAEHRLYNKGDSVKHIDWKVFGKTDRLYVKKFDEETNLRCCIAIDISPSMYFPAANKSKLKEAVFAAACILTIFKRQLDASAIALFDKELLSLTAFKSSTRHYRDLINQLQRLLSLKQPETGGTHIQKALHEIAERIHQRSLVVLISDLNIPAEEEEAFMQSLLHLKYNKHEILLIQVVDEQFEMNFEFENRPFELIDLETNATIRLDPNTIRATYQKAMLAKRERFENYCLQHKIDLVTHTLKEPINKVLTEYLQKRSKMM